MSAGAGIPDAFAPGKDMMLTAEALASLLEAVTPLSERISMPLIEAAGRILAEDVMSDRDVPPHDNAAVDGYAVFVDDLPIEGTRTLPVTGRIAAGHVFDRTARRGEALRIFTGAPVPFGPDAVIAQESCCAAGDQVILPPARRGDNLRKKGEDIRSGDVILSAGMRLRPQDVGLAASIGLNRLAVVRRPRVALFSTGDEVCPPGQPAVPGAIYDANRFVLGGLLKGIGADVADYGIVRDQRSLLQETLTRAVAEGCDAIITSGGVSSGEEDHVKAAIEGLGALRFWRIAIRPGRPLAFGHVGGVPLIGLPGNPVACMLTFLIFARPALLRLAGAAVVAPQYYPVTADFSFKKRIGRREWLRGSLRRDADGHLVAHPFPHEGSGILTSMVASQGLIELPEAMAAVHPGDQVDFLPFSETLG